MAYVLVMGGLALSVSFTLGWALWRLVRVALGWLGGGSPSGATKVKPKARKPAARKPARKASANESSATESSTGRAATPRKAAARKAARPPREPWGLTRGLAANRSLLPLASLALMLYAFGRLVVFGLQHRPVEAPASFAQVVMVLGWAAAVLVGLALLSLLARWRCRD